MTQMTQDASWPAELYGCNYVQVEAQASRGDKCEGRSCVRRARKNRWRSRLCVARRFHAKLAKDGDVTVAVSHAPYFDKKQRTYSEGL
jgi:hypothetical protein